MPEAAPTRIIAVIPAHDEAARIGVIVAGAAAHLRVVVVDDGSGDETAAIARAAGATVIEQRPNRGKGAALRTGFRHALDLGVDAVITLDGDGQHDPAEIPGFIAVAAARRGAPLEPELVVGRRDFGAMPLVRRLSNLAGTLVLSGALGRWIPDNQSGYRLVGRRLLAATLDSREDGFAFEVEMIAICQREGWPIAWLPIRTIYGGERSHIRPVRHLLEFLAAAARARRISRGARRFSRDGRSG